VAAGVVLQGTRYLHPPRFLSALGEACARAGVEMRTGTTVTAVDGGSPTRGAEVRFHTRSPGGRPGADSTARADLVVVAAGVHSGRLLRPHGVRRLVQAGRGY